MTRPASGDPFFDKGLPSNPEAERSILGAILLDNTVCNQAIELLRREDFFLDSHRRIYDKMVALTERGMPIDLITLTDELRRAAEFEQIGGATYIASLIDGVPRTDTIEHYAKIVKQKAMLRRLITASNQIIARAFDEEDDPDIIIDQAEQLIFQIAEDRVRQGFQYIGDVAQRRLEQIEQMAGRPEMITGVPTGFTDFDQMTSGLQRQDLIIIAARPSMGKTALALNMAQYAAKNGHTIGIFSLEMSAEQLVSRLLCSEARVDAHRLRTGYLNREEWARLADALRRLTETQIYIDDTAGVGVLEMRAKTRRLKAERGLDMLIIDYLQLMAGRGRIESRQQEVSQISRDLKGLAKELDVPVIALSQLSRAPEQRSEHKPQLSDLRECVSGNTLLIDAQTGLLVPISRLEAGRRILALGEKQKIGAFTVDDVWSTGKKQIYEVRTRTNRSITATANHPFLTPYGWKRLEELRQGDLIATCLRLPFHGEEKSERADMCRFLGYMTGDGTSLRHREVGFISADEKVFADVKHLVTKHFPEVTIRQKRSAYFECNFVRNYENGYGKPGGNPLREWLKQVGAFGKRDSEKRVPEWVLEAGLVGAREFLAGLFATDGCAQIRHQGAGGRVDIRFDTTSRLLAEDVRHLLLRLGIASTISSGYKSKKATKPIYRISVVGAENMALFARTVPFVGAKAMVIKEAERIIRTRAITNPGLLALPKELSAYLHSVAPGWRNQGKKMRRDTCLKWAEKLEDRKLEEWGNSDLLWEAVADIFHRGEDEVFDIRVQGAHNFIANGIVAHNSGAIEQDADVVCFIYREEVYNQTEENQGKAELIIAKQRNGPVGSVGIAFLKQFTRFENMVFDDRML